MALPLLPSFFRSPKFSFLHADNPPFRKMRNKENREKSLDSKGRERGRATVDNQLRIEEEVQEDAGGKKAEEEEDSRAHYPPEGYLQEERKGGGGGGDTFLHRGENAPRRGILISPLFPQYPRRNEEHAYLPLLPSPRLRKRERERDTFSRQWEAKRNETKRNEAERRSATNIHGMTPRKLKATAADAPAALKPHGERRSIRGERVRTTLALNRAQSSLRIFS